VATIFSMAWRVSGSFDDIFAQLAVASTPGPRGLAVMAYSKAQRWL
jgi:hypothetical protein